MLDYQALLFDMDGVLYNDDRPIAGAADAVARVRASGIPYLFVTNTTSTSRAALVEKLARFGIPADPRRILTPCVAAADWLRAHGGGPAALFVREAALAEFAGIPTVPGDAEAGAASVVIGDLAEQWDFRKLNRAFRLLHHNPAARLVALGMTRYWLARDGVSLDVAPFVAALQHATGREPLVLGKPAEPFFAAACEKLGLPRSAVAMIGDDIRADIAGAQAAGLRGILVRTGKFRESDLDTGIHPDAVLDSVAILSQGL